ncbi:MAG: GNAT family acetyltransferase [Cycloclasticus sp.]|nr:GNAT family acetyltransferase [Cycloclasticus sp. 44_32_T64]
MSTYELEHAVFRKTEAIFNLMSFEEDILALVSLINQCRSSISIYSHTLNPTVFDTEPVISAFEKFCLKNSRTKVNILVNESRPITRISHRLLGLSHRHSSSIFFKKIDSVVSSREDDFVCFDRSAYFQLPNHQHYAGICNFADAENTARFLSYFKEAWEQSAPDIELRSIPL